MVSAQRHYTDVPDEALMVNSDVGFTSADIDQHASEFFLVFAQDRLSGRNGFENRIAHQQSASIDGSHNVLSRGRRACDDVNVDFEPGSHHAQGIADSTLI